MQCIKIGSWHSNKFIAILLNCSIKYKMLRLKQDIDLRGCLKWTLQLIRVAGYWFPRSGNSSKTLIYATYSTTVITFTLIVYMFTEAAYLLLVFGQMEEMVDSLFLTLTQACQCLKIIVFITQKEKIYGLLDCLEEDIFKPKTQHQLKKAAAIINYTNRIAKTLIGLVVFTVVIWSLSTVLDDERQTPVKSWYPFSIENSPQYELVCTYQLLAILFCGCANGSMDMIAATFISQICVQLDILSDNIVHIKESGELCLAEEQMASATDGLNVSSDVERKMKCLLKQCIRHHLKILE